MNVLLCAADGRRPTGPVRRPDEMPGYPGWDGFPGPDCRRHGPPSVPRGTHTVDPPPSGAPFEPVGPDEEYDGIVPGGTWMSDERGSLVSAGPRGTCVPHPDDVVDIAPRPVRRRPVGCRGPAGRAGTDHVRACGAEAAIVAAGRTSGYGARLVPDAVRVEAAA
ncbi:hypothetical protein ACFUIT_34000 [Streptomyces sp. NPDC057239]|uniref:hypothetical protein n=1 Tax=Streptomyces sp. NPDC057239 TaxID=3346061 RepID=UPI00362FC9F7